MFIPNKTVKKIRAASAAPLTFILYHLSFIICHLAKLCFALGMGEAFFIIYRLSFVI